MYEAQFPPLPSAPRSAREWARTQLDAWSLPHMADFTELLLTELVANVVRHVGEPMAVRMTRFAQGIRVEVDDPSVQLPTTQELDLTREQGRGLMLVAGLANRWGTELHRHPRGKTVWFELEVD